MYREQEPVYPDRSDGNLGLVVVVGMERNGWIKYILELKATDLADGLEMQDDGSKEIWKMEWMVVLIV